MFPHGKFTPECCWVPQASVLRSNFFLLYFDELCDVVICNFAICDINLYSECDRASDFKHGSAFIDVEHNTGDISFEEKSKYNSHVCKHRPVKTLCNMKMLKRKTY